MHAVNENPQRSSSTVGSNPHHARVPRRLYGAAQAAARTAIACYASYDEREQLEAAYSIGAAAEYLGRAVVASYDPLLLAKADSPDSQIMLSRANTSSALDPLTLRTIDSQMVWKLLQRLSPKFAPLAEKGGRASKLSPVTTVMTVRNAAAHMALVERSHLEDAARALISVVESLHPLGSLEESDFWPADLMATVQLLKDENSTAAALQYQSKLMTARAQLERLLNGMTAEEQERIQTMLEARSLPELTLERQKEVAQVCPACARLGVAVYVVEEGEPQGGEWEETRGGSFVHYGWGRTLNYYASFFRCAVCALQLGADEFTAASIPVELDEDWEEIEDPYADWEPDEDELRGR